MAHFNIGQTSRWLSAGLLALLTGVALYLCTLGARWPTLDTLPVWGFEMAYAVCAGALHFLLWPLWRRRLGTALPQHLPSL